MNLSQLSLTLEKLYNTLGNEYITQNFESEPFEFKVHVRNGVGESDIFDYVVEVSADREIPRSFKYKENAPEKGWADGVDISKLKHVFKEYIKYVVPHFGKFRSTFGVKFINK